MMRHSGLAMFCLAAVLFMSTVYVPPVAGSQYTVAPSGGGFTSIQDAVTWAAPLDTITVWSGTYPEMVKIDKKITLIGVDTGGGLPVIDREKREPLLKSPRMDVPLRDLLSRTARPRAGSSFPQTGTSSKIILLRKMQRVSRLCLQMIILSLATRSWATAAQVLRSGMQKTT